MTLKKFNIEKWEFVYLCTYALYVFASIIDSSLLTIGILKTLINYVSILLLGTLFIIKSKSAKQIQIYVLLSVFIFAALSTSRLYLLVYMMLLINARYSTFRHIVKTSFIMTVFSVLFVVLCCKAGIVEDLVYSRNGVENAHSYGFGHYSSISYFALYLTIMWLYLRQTVIGYLEIAAIIAFNLGIYYATTTRLGFYIAILVIIMYIVLVKFDFINTASKLFMFFASIGFYTTFIVCLIINYFYDSTNPTLLMIDKLLNNRLGMGNTALKLYNPKLFGQMIEMVGIKTAVFGTGNNTYFYIDSGYIYALLGYGIIFTLIILTLYTMVMRNTAKNKQYVLLIWSIAVMLFTVSNNAWVSITYNPLLFYVVISEKNNLLKQFFAVRKNKFKLKIKI